jgi:hypothetical protein
VRAKTENIRRLSKRLLALGKLLFPNRSHATKRPVTRADCASVPRPCPFVSCRYNLYLDVDARNGSIKLNFPDLEPDEMTNSCALDVADRGQQRLEDVSPVMNVTRERVRQIEEQATKKLRRLPVVRELGREA